MDQITQNLNKQNLRCFEINSPKENFVHFSSNYIKTTKYTFYSFLPLSLLNQYKRLANIYFLALSILGLIPSISPWTPITQILPTIFVLAVAIIREAIEDYYRYKSDTESNSQPVKKVIDDGTLIEIKSSQIMVGDIIWVPDEIEIPADILILGGGNVQSLGGQVECFVHTSSLDGEKNLKKKAAPKGLRVENDMFLLKKQLSAQELFPLIEGSILCDLPNKDLHQFHGVLSVRKVNQFDMKTIDPEQIDIFNEQQTQYILSENNILLKGTKLMNTPKGIIGIVTYNGLDTKLLQNQNKSRYKQSGVEIETNKIVMGMLIFTILAGLVLAYLEFRQIQQIGDSSYYLYKNDIPSKNALYQFVVTFLSNICLNSTFIPISLLVAIECSKVIQAYFIISDIELITLEYDEEIEIDSSMTHINQNETKMNKDKQPEIENQRLPVHMQPCTVQTCSLNEELGQVRFIFSDKTGTLTRNMMEFRLCKIGKQIYGDQSSLFDKMNENQNNDISHNKSMQSGRSIDIEQQSQRSNMSRASQASKRSTVNMKQKVSYKYKNVQLEEILYDNIDQNVVKSNFEMVSNNGKVKFEFKNQKKLVNEFLKCLSTTHECMANKVKSKIDSQIEQITYQGTSPDEVALIEFAQKHGYEFISGTDEHIQVQKKLKSYQNIHQNNIAINGTLNNQNIWMNDTILDFQLLRKMEFNSDRKRMSILVKDISDGYYKLYTKGADNIIKERLNEIYFTGKNLSTKSQDKLYKKYSQIELIQQNSKSTLECKNILVQTNEFLFQASVQGYRTLLIGMKILDEEEVNKFLEECNTAEKDIQQRNKNLDEVYDRWEQGLYLIGATVVEDRLQDQVPETIQALHQANIKVWVLTGDKLETAESIGFSSKLLTSQMDILRCRDSEDVNELFNQEQALENELLLIQGKKRALVIESIAIKILLDQQNFEIRRWFLKISRTMETVICCRVSPSQKAEVVRMIKQDDPEIITLAIGDGANDVPMILEADIGVGLYGKEGMRAVDTSDYAVAEFRHLWTLLFKWGRWNYTRQTLNINYYFYKNFVYTLFQILFQQSNFYSSQPIFPDAFLSLFNMMFTAWPVACYSINELDICPKSYDSSYFGNQQGNQKALSLKQDELLYQSALDPAYIRQFIPNIYFPGQRNLMFNSWTFFCWIFIGLVECFIIYLISYVVYSNGHVLNKRGETGDLWSFGMTIFTSLLYVVTNKLQLRIMKYDWFVVHTIFFLTYVFYYLFIYITDNWYLSFQQSFTFMILYEMPIFYLTIFLCISICFIIDFMIESVTQIFMKDARDLLKYQIIKNNSEITQDFLEEFDKLVKIENSIQRIEDQLKEQELSLVRIMKSNISQEELEKSEKNKRRSLKMQNNKQLADSSNIISLKIIRIFYSFVLRYTNLIPLNTNIVDNSQSINELNKKEAIIRKKEKELIIQDEDRIVDEQMESPQLTQVKNKLSQTYGQNKVQDQNTVTNKTSKRLTVIEPVSQKQVNNNSQILLDFTAKSRIHESQQKLPIYLQVDDQKDKRSKEKDNMLNNRIFSQQIELKQLNDSCSINSLQEKSGIQIEIQASDQNGSSKQIQKASDYDHHINSKDQLPLDNTVIANVGMKFDNQMEFEKQNHSIFNYYKDDFEFTQVQSEQQNK